MNQKPLRLIFAFLLISIGISGRLFIDIPNVETVTVVTLLAGVLLGGSYLWLIPLLVVGLSDMIIGNDLILLYTWTAWVGIGVLSRWIPRSVKSIFSQTTILTGAGVVSSLFFFVWTNFGVWHLSGMYPHTFTGLLESYMMGLPFLKYQVLGNLMLVPSISLVILGAWKAIQAIQAVQPATTDVSIEHAKS